MKSPARGRVVDVERAAKGNTNFRQVLYTDRNMQLVVMSLNPGQDIGEETHDVDQFLRIEEGAGSVSLSGVVSSIKDGTAIVVPAGVKHNVTNGKSGPMKLYTLYAPPVHRAGTIHKTKAAAESDPNDKFEGSAGRKPFGSFAP